MLDLYNIKAERLDWVKTPYLQRFRSFEEILEIVEEGVDAELKAMVTAVNRYGKALPGVLKRVEEACVAPEHADFCLSSGHRSKGKEWAETEVNDDFLPVHDPDKLHTLKIKQGRVAFDQEVNLLYVALTRTRSKVVMPASMREWFETQAKLATA
jgi:hypothetical protein